MVFAIASIAELQSIATMEAMASGRPVVAADAMALPHLVHDGDNGYLFPPDDVDVFADRLLKVLTADQDELDRLSENSLHLIQAHDINRTISIFENLYRGGEDEDKTTDDNREEYSKPIGRLSEAVRERMQAWRVASLELRERASDVREEVRDRLDEIKEEVAEKLDDIKEEVVERAKAVDEKVRQSVRKASRRKKSEEG